MDRGSAWVELDGTGRVAAVSAATVGELRSAAEAAFSAVAPVTGMQFRVELAWGLSFLGNNAAALPMTPSGEPAWITATRFAVLRCGMEPGDRPAAPPAVPDGGQSAEAGASAPPWAPALVLAPVPMPVGPSISLGHDTGAIHVGEAKLKDEPLPYLNFSLVDAV